jgi:hypothetical protein
MALVSPSVRGMTKLWTVLLFREIYSKLLWHSAERTEIPFSNQIQWLVSLTNLSTESKRGAEGFEAGAS